MILSIIAIALFGALRGGLLLRRPLWHDEIFTVWASRLPLGALIRQLRSDSGPPLWYLIEKPFVLMAETFHFSDRFLRVPAWFAGLGVMAIGCSFPPGRSRRTFLILAATSFLLFLYSAEARAYALLALLDLALFLRAARGKEDLKRLGSVVFLVAAALYCHYLAIFFVVALAITLVSLRRWRSLAAIVAGSALFAPWVPIFLGQPAGALRWLREPPGRTLAGFAAALGGTGRTPGPFGPPLPNLLFWLGVAGGAAGAIGLGLLQRKDRDLRAAVTLTAVTMGLVFLASFFRPIVFSGRTELAVIGIWIWALARSVRTSRLVSWAYAASAVMGTIAIVLSLVVKYEDPVWKPATDVLARLAGPSDRIFAGAGFYLPMRLAADRGQIRAEVESFPADLAEHPGWFMAAPAEPRDYQELDRRLALVPSGSRAFLLLHPYYAIAVEREIETKGVIQELVRRSDAVLLVWISQPGQGAGSNRG